MELLRSAIAQALLTKKPIPDVPLLTLVRESLIEQIRVRFPDTTGNVAAEPVQANCFGVVDFRAWLDCIPQRYRNIKIEKWIHQEENLLLFTGRFLVEKEVVRFPLEPPTEQKTSISDYYWELSPYVRDHRELKDSDVYICKLVKRENNGEKFVKCAFEIFIIQPSTMRKFVQIAQREIRKSITGSTGQNLDEKPKVREYNVRWIAPGLEVMSKVSELYSYMQRQQLYLSSEIEKRIRRLEDVRLEFLALNPDQPSPEVRLAAQEALRQFFAEFRDALYRQRDKPHMELTGKGCPLNKPKPDSSKSNVNLACPLGKTNSAHGRVAALLRRNTLGLLKTSDKPAEKIKI